MSTTVLCVLFGCDTVIVWCAHWVGSLTCTSDVCLPTVCLRRLSPLYISHVYLLRTLLWVSLRRSTMCISVVCACVCVYGSSCPLVHHQSIVSKLYVVVFTLFGVCFYCLWSRVLRECPLCQCRSCVSVV